MDKSKLFSNHPGRIILEEFLAPRGISVSRLANDLDVPARRIYELVQGQRSINSDLAHRLAHYFGMSERGTGSIYKFVMIGRQLHQAHAELPRKRKLG